MPSIIPQKTCSKCKQSLPATTEHFHKDKKGKYGLVSTCKPCATARARQWGADNQDYANQQARDYYYAHLDERKAYNEANKDHRRAWKEENKEHFQQVSREYRQRNRERLNEYNREYRRTHKEWWLQTARNHYYKNRIRYAPANRARAKAWAKANPDKMLDYSHKRRALLMGNGGDGFTKADKELQLRSQKGNCWWCLKPMNKDITIDHIVPISKGGQHDPRNIVLAHRSCNCSKKAKLPHEWIGRLF